jgi:hypothetical protein
VTAGIVLSFIEKKKSQRLDLFDQIGNSYIDWRESEGILKNVKRIEGLGILA